MCEGIPEENCWIEGIYWKDTALSLKRGYTTPCLWRGRLFKIGTCSRVSFEVTAAILPYFFLQLSYNIWNSCDTPDIYMIQARIIQVLLIYRVKERKADLVLVKLSPLMFVICQVHLAYLRLFLFKLSPCWPVQVIICLFNIAHVEILEGNAFITSDLIFKIISLPSLNLNK